MGGDRVTAHKLIEIFCDGNKRVGYGHIRRSGALAAQLRQKGFEVRLTGLSKDSKDLLPPNEFFKGRADIVVFDSMVGVDNMIETARRENQVSVTLDWFGTKPDINIVVYPHSEVRATLRKYIGFEYIIIRDEITSVKRIPTVYNRNKVLICIGGSDILDQGYEAAAYLADKGYEVTLIRGPLATKRSGKTKFRVLVSPSNYPELLASCDWSVTNGGGCLFEALYLGKPAVVLPQTDFEIRIAEFVEKEDALLGIGFDALKDVRLEKLEIKAARGMKLIDGGGLGRIAKIIEEII